MVEHKWAVLLCLVLILAGMLRINDLSLITPDSSRYLIWGNSLANFKGTVDDTQPLPVRYVVHAPLYSLLIAPVELFFPFSTEAAKVWTLLWGAAAVALFYGWLHRNFGKSVALAGAFVFASSPLLLVYSTEVLSEAPFLVIMISIFLISQKILEGEGSSAKREVLLVVLSAAAVLLREVGIAAAGAASALFLVSGRRKLAASTLGCSILVLVLWYIRNRFLTGAVSPADIANTELVFQHFATPPEAPLWQEFSVRLWQGLNEYAVQLGSMLLYPLYLTKQFRLSVLPSPLHQAFQELIPAIRYLIVAVALPSAVYGIYTDLRSSSSAVQRLTFLSIYLVMILIYPARDIRFLLPLLPLLVFYLSAAANRYRERRSPSVLAKPGFYTSAALLALMIPNLSSSYEILKVNMEYRSSPEAFYRKLTALPSYPLLFTQPWSIMGQWIRNHTPDTAVFASPYKELSTVVGGRKVLEIEPRSPLPVFESLLRDNQVAYLLSPTRRQDLTVFEFNMSESRRFRFDHIYSTANLHLFRVYSRLLENPAADSLPQAPRDSLAAAGLLHQARASMLNGEYTQSERFLSAARNREPDHPEVLFQAVVLQTLKCDSGQAQAYYQRLLNLPQALGYVLPARTQIEAMQLLLKARSQKFHPSMAVGEFNAATAFWKLGYGRRAACIMDSVVLGDSTYFVGLLWALHFNLQTGDTARSSRYLEILERIDWTNPVVQAFRSILDTALRLKAEESASARSRMHLEIGLLYKKIELFEEALDEAERALFEDPGNIQARLLMAQVYDNKKMPLAAERAYRRLLAADPENSMARGKLDSLGRIISNL